MDGEARSLRVIAVYYVVLVGLAVLVAWQIPQVQEIFDLDRLRGFTEAQLSESMGGQSLRDARPEMRGWAGIVVSATAMLASLAFMVPVAWTYIVIKRQTGYEQSLVHTLLILPVAVTGIVLIVQNDLALAFSLAGIVAAVRFRTTLDDTKDAVYVFLGIGVGLACGVLALPVALVLSVVFNAVNLVLWRMNFGNIYADQFKRTRPLKLADVLAGPGSAQTGLSIGDRDLLTALTPHELREAATHVAHVERHLEDQEERHRERKKYAVLLVYTKQVGPAQSRVEAEIDERSVRWRLAEIFPHREDVSILEYLVRMKEGIQAGELLDAIRRSGDGTVLAVEFRSLEGLKKKP